MKNTLLLYLSLLSVILLSCATSKQVTVSKHSDAQFRNVHTYHIIHTDTVNRPGFMDRILRSEMEQMGFQYDSISPDFTLSYAGKVDKRYAMQRMMPGMYGPGWDWYGMPPYAPTYATYEYLESTLVIDILDLKNEQILWQGSQMNRINDMPSKKDIAKAVQTIFKQFAAQFQRRQKAPQK